MKTIALNTTVSDRLFNLVVNNIAHSHLYNCNEDCDEIDLIYIDNDCVENYTLNKEKKATHQQIVFSNNEMYYYDGDADISLFLETLYIDIKIKKLIKKFDLSTRYIAEAIGKSEATVKQMRGNTKYYDFKDSHYDMILTRLKKDMNELVRNP